MKKISFAILIILLLSYKPSNSEFVWDFSSKKTFIYTLSSKTETTNKPSIEKPVEKSQIKGKGFLYVKTKENNLADISLINLKQNVVTLNEDGSSKDTILREIPTTVIYDMKENGSFSNPNTDIFFDLIFPLPSIDLKIGEYDEIRMQNPFNANGVILSSHGINKLTFTGYQTIDDIKCAVLKSEFDISKVKVPSEFEGAYNSSTKGQATYYFNSENHHYVGSDIKMEMTILLKTDDKNDLGVFLDMSNQQIIQIRLEKIIE